jgi:cyanate permease
MDENHAPDLHVDDVESNTSNIFKVVGTVKLIDDFGVNLVPTPTRDPNDVHSLSIHTNNERSNTSTDPLNLPIWQKYVILIIVGIYAATANLMTNGMSAFLPAVAASYGNDPKTHALVTWPAFFMGVGNLISIPVAHAIGRRPVYLTSTIMLTFGCLWCAKSGSLASHIGGRDIMSIGAGTAEALCLIIVQEVFYLHERGRVIAWFCALQTVGHCGFDRCQPVHRV